MFLINTTYIILILQQIVNKTLRRKMIQVIQKIIFLR